MKVDKNDVVAGIKIVKIRDFLIGKSGVQFTSRSIENFFGATPTRGREIEAALLSAGYIEPVQRDQGHFVISELGSRLRNAKFMSRINRTKADKIVSEFLSRVDDVNSNDEYTHKVESVRAFGSYIGDGDHLGDIDLAISIKFRGTGSIVEANHRRADLSGRNLSFFQRLTYGESEVRKLVKGRNQYLSLHEYDDPVDLKTPFKVIYPR